MKKKYVLLAGLLCLGLLIYVGVRSFLFLNAPLKAGGGSRIFAIPEGASYRQVVRNWARQNMIRDPLVMEWYGRLTGKGQKIQAGYFEIDLSMTPRQLLDQLISGCLVSQIRLTVPEGFNRWQVADLLEEKGLARRDAFLKRVEDEKLEGKLFPDTYFFNKNASLDKIVGRLTARFDSVFQALIAGRNLDADEERDLLILASLVEKEARTDRDRGLCARVFYNRLAKGMKLQTDPTCVYSEQLYKSRANPSTCRDQKNLYSTYVISGLPPGPISNPGLASLKAALDPPSGPDVDRLIYFVAKRDGSGEHFFSETYEEHQKAVNRYLKGQND